MNLEPPDTMYISAAIGWLELGNLTEAKAELEHVTQTEHPAVLEVRWQLLAKEQSWEEALKVATRLVAAAPDCADGWLHRAYASRRAVNGTVEKAWELLLPAAELFPKEPVIPYNLACYACQMGKTKEARRWLRQAVRVGNAEVIKKMALEDTDLEPMRKEIEEM